MARSLSTKTVAGVGIAVLVTVVLFAAIYILQGKVLNGDEPQPAGVTASSAPSSPNEPPGETETPVDYSFNEPTLDDRAIVGITDMEKVDDATLAKIRQQLHTEYDAFAKENADKIPDGSVVNFDQAIASCMSTDPPQTERACIQFMYMTLNTSMFERSGGAPFTPEQVKDGE